MKSILMLSLVFGLASTHAADKPMTLDEVVQLRRELRDLKRAQQNLHAQIAKLPGKLIRGGAYTMGLTGIGILGHYVVRGPMVENSLPRMGANTVFRVGVAMLTAGLVLYPVISSPELVTEEEQAGEGEANSAGPAADQSTQPPNKIGSVYLSPVGFQHYLQLDEKAQVELAGENSEIRHAVRVFHQALSNPL